MSAILFRPQCVNVCHTEFIFGNMKMYCTFYPFPREILRKRPPFRRRSFKCIFFDENIRISINISLKFVPKGQISNIPALVQIMAWRRPGHKPLSEPMMVRLLTYMCHAASISYTTPSIPWFLMTWYCKEPGNDIDLFILEYSSSAPLSPMMPILYYPY